MIQGVVVFVSVVVFVDSISIRIQFPLCFYFSLSFSTVPVGSPLSLSHIPHTPPTPLTPCPHLSHPTHIPHTPPTTLTTRPQPSHSAHIHHTPPPTLTPRPQPLLLVSIFSKFISSYFSRLFNFPPLGSGTVHQPGSSEVLRARDMTANPCSGTDDRTLRLYLEPAPVPHRAPSLDGLPTVELKDLVSLSAVINGFPCKVVTDSGTSQTFVSHKMARRLGLLSKV